jgi:hypothetical protein
MFVNPGNVGLALDGQLILRWRFVILSQRFSRLPGLPWQARKYSVRRDTTTLEQESSAIDGSWFETAPKRLLTMKVEIDDDLTLRHTR